MFKTRPLEKDQRGTKPATGSTAGSATEKDQGQHSQAADQGPSQLQATLLWSGNGKLTRTVPA